MFLVAEVASETVQDYDMEFEEDVNEVPYVEPLKPEQIRWFYKDGVDKRWIEFCGYDSLRIEAAWRRKVEREKNTKENKENRTNRNDTESCETVVVKGGMYDVELDKLKCISIYWPGK